MAAHKGHQEQIQRHQPRIWIDSPAKGAHIRNAYVSFHASPKIALCRLHSVGCLGGWDTRKVCQVTTAARLLMDATSGKSAKWLLNGKPWCAYQMEKECTSSHEDTKRKSPSWDTREKPLPSIIWQIQLKWEAQINEFQIMEGCFQIMQSCLDGDFMIHIATQRQWFLRQETAPWKMWIQTSDGLAPTVSQSSVYHLALAVRSAQMDNKHLGWGGNHWAPTAAYIRLCSWMPMRCTQKRTLSKWWCWEGSDATAIRLIKAEACARWSDFAPLGMLNNWLKMAI